MALSKWMGCACLGGVSECGRFSGIESCMPLLERFDLLSVSSREVFLPIRGVFKCDGKG